VFSSGRRHAGVRTPASDSGAPGLVRYSVERRRELLWVACTVLALAGMALQGCGRPARQAEVQRSAPTRTGLERTGTPEGVGPGYPTPSSGAENALVMRAVDGDTLDVVLRKGTTEEQRVRVRLIGVDAPESVDPRRPVQCFGREASRFAQRLEGQTVRLDYDVERYDKYGRVLAYVFLDDGVLFNLLLVEEGYALPYTVPPNVRYQQYFLEASKRAREAGKGLWSACR
jgi:micrococcal nuclease